MLLIQVIRRIFTVFMSLRDIVVQCAISFVRRRQQYLNTKKLGLGRNSLRVLTNKNIRYDVIWKITRSLNKDCAMICEMRRCHDVRFCSVFCAYMNRKIVINPLIKMWGTIPTAMQWFSTFCNDTPFGQYLSVNNPLVVIMRTVMRNVPIIILFLRWTVIMKSLKKLMYFRSTFAQYRRHGEGFLGA